MRRYSIAVKFIALCLAALCLLSAVGSGLGILFLTVEDLYEKPFDDYYSDAKHATRQDFAVQLIHRYVSLNLGNLPEEYLNNYRGIDWMYETFRYGYFYYAIYNEFGECVETTMAGAPEGGRRYETVVTNLRYRALVEILGTEPVQQDTSEEPTQPDSMGVTIPADAQAAGYTITRDAELHYDSYYDHESGEMVEFTFTYRDLPPYTVELYLMPEAMPEEYSWTLLRGIWTGRYQLFYLLGVSVLLFAVCMVYLCLAAGRKRGSDAVKAGGLNRIPLDLYLVGGGTVLVFGLSLWVKALDYILYKTPNIVIPVTLLGGFGLCLPVVAFLFACAAQFKTADNFWWRNSLTGRCLGLFAGLGKKFTIICAWIFRRLPKFLKKAFGWLGGKLAAFYSLLPLIWQWLLAGAVLLLALVFALLTRSEGMLVLAVCLGFVLIVYGATSFGILLDAARRMGKGDLEVKVSDKHLLGAFKDFAGDLNALADVAVVAARNQLKSERMKTELITNVSHDIKTPLTSIINYVDLLQKPHTEEEQEMYLEVLSRQSGQLKKLIEDLMEMSKASTGNMTVDIMAVDAVEAVNQALGEFSDKFARIQLTPVFRQPEEPVYMKADGRLAWRVLSNLLSNAYKYALPGTRLYIDLMELDGKVIISLKNISREELNVSADELLERFVRGDVSRNTEGSGLGLNIAQSLMELQKGQLQLLVDGDLFKVTLVFPTARME
ncbi:MAG: HAMP domain-containing histidine kinase [Oscillospiraceae bacterium]|nr:HAMP domain-containing histidine kinase [Oscillospiraceae bacterium]